MRRNGRQVTDRERMLGILDECDIAHVAMVDGEGMP